MDRRGLFRILGAGVAAASLPGIAVADSNTAVSSERICKPEAEDASIKEQLPDLVKFLAHPETQKCMRDSGQRVDWSAVGKMIEEVNK